MVTSESLHPGPLIDAQVVVYNLEDVSQKSVHVFRGHRCAAAFVLVWVVVWSMFPPVRHVAAQHGQHHLQRKDTFESQDLNATGQIL